MPEDDELARRLYPPRTKANLAIRNSRFADLLTLPHSDGVLRLRLTALLGFDYITAANVLTASFLFEEMDWWGFWAACGAFSRDAEHFRVVTREGSDVVKKYRTSIPPDLRVVLYENSSLYGALFPPVPGWDPVAQAAALAAGGKIDHGVPGLPGWDREAVLARIDALRHYGRTHPSTTLTLRDWLEQGDWERSGCAVSYEPIRTYARATPRRHGFTAGQFKASNGWTTRFMKWNRPCLKGQKTVCQRLPPCYENELLRQDPQLLPQEAMEKQGTAGNPCLPHTVPLVPRPPLRDNYADAANNSLAVVTPDAALTILTLPDRRIFEREAVAWTLAALLAPPRTIIDTDNFAIVFRVVTCHNKEGAPLTLDPHCCQSRRRALTTTTLSFPPSHFCDWLRARRRERSPLPALEENGRITSESDGAVSTAHASRGIRAKDNKDYTITLPPLPTGAYQMNHVWAVTFKTADSKKMLARPKLGG
ncbi:hypothetical protein HPB47_014435 [Ixodes persulcatus]|uniref:Uncharacterized protein n=1 Tax=Ixodes persulcatus TaxID=34615 RepID=A0AC60QW36_IXOPE|nr:hypothetical protein HPB47_014435 [Ixodes persulcatus]